MKPVMEFVLCRWYNDTLRAYMVNQNTGNMRRIFVAADLAQVPDQYKAVSMHCMLHMDEPKPKDPLYAYSIPQQLRNVTIGGGLATAYHVAKIPAPE